MAEFKLPEILKAFTLIGDDLSKAHPEPQKFSVVNLSGHIDDPNPRDPSIALIKAMIQHIMVDLDVSVVTTAGNVVPGGSTVIDEPPAIWAGPDYPLIVVGNADPAGQNAYSKTGPQLTTYAVGEDITCFWDDPVNPTTKDGTSYDKFQLVRLPAHISPI